MSPSGCSRAASIACVAGCGLWLVARVVAQSAPPIDAIAAALGWIAALVCLVAARRAQARAQRVESAADVRAHEVRYATLVQRSIDATVVVDSSGIVTWAGGATLDVLGARPATMLGRTFEERAEPGDAEALRRLLASPQVGGPVARGLTWRARRADGTTTLVETLVTDLRADPGVRGVVTHSRDVSERRALEDQLAHQAFHDALTALPNRALFRDRVDHAIARAMRRGTRVDVVFLDLDGFKTVNDSLGHDAGDQVLLAAAERLRRGLRDGDTAARLGGDEFGVLLEECASEEAAADIAARITSAFAAPFIVRGREVVATASVGLATASMGDTSDVVLRNADAAMYVAKRNGRGRLERFVPEMHADAVSQLELQGDLHRALERGELRLDYQPIVSLVDGATRGAEALLRWVHPRRGPVSPATFVPVAERTGLIVPIGAWILEQACMDAAGWPATPEGSPAYVTINVSIRQLQDSAIVEHVLAALESSAIDPSRVTLELTESGLMEDREAAVVTLAKLRELGVRIAVDDFGTGYSSLEYLHRLPIDVLKIPKPFVDGIRDDETSSTLPRAILSIADTLGLDVVAEGIESADQARRLFELGCELGQGFLFSPPMQAGDVAGFLRAPAKSVTSLVS